jgi:hypothetical protein
MSNLPTIFTDKNSRKLQFQESSKKSLEKRIIKLFSEGCYRKKILLINGKAPARCSLEDYAAEYKCHLTSYYPVFPLEDILEGKKREMLYFTYFVTKSLSGNTLDTIGIFVRMPSRKLGVLTNIISSGKWSITRVFSGTTLRLVSSDNFIASLLSRSI